MPIILSKMTFEEIIELLKELFDGFEKAPDAVTRYAFQSGLQCAAKQLAVLLSSLNIASQQL